ncbi:class I SAM-dependent methyltransferase [Phenylobacterium sp.]|uniref:class I SAM-dependent methyltransferase n=1 Tax=Phenylobacterium sp. TaxID=1871053 RepID=UPI002B95F123|nr:class I SAM-dependent methyltransferase [Phenylobacterium sp.]HVI31523.1 class I SAM-dependent methyltransferase [Phenylobacterium sp.]
MEATPAQVLISLDPPYRIADDATEFVFLGWAQVDDPAAPDVRMTVNGVEVPVRLGERPPNLHLYYKDVEALTFFQRVHLVDLLRAAPPPPEPFLLEVAVVSDGRSRVFEYAVSEAWLRRVYGRPVRARAIPPEPLQIRVTGAAAGEFHRTGRTTAEQIAGILARGGRPLDQHRRILDFGCGPGRVIDCVHDMHPQAELFGCDIDGEAIAWAAGALGEVADFRVNGLEPPLPFEDESFDLIYGISVFTHLPEDLQNAWLFELRRVLKPGGTLLTTKLDAAGYDYVPEPVKQAFARDGFVFWGEADITEGLPDVYRLAYHTDDYVRRVWGAYFDVLHIGSHDLNRTQDAVLMRRPRHALSWLPPKLRRRLHALKALAPA